MKGGNDGCDMSRDGSKHVKSPEVFEKKVSPYQLLNLFISMNAPHGLRFEREPGEQGEMQSTAKKKMKKLRQSRAPHRFVLQQFYQAPPAGCQCNAHRNACMKTANLFELSIATTHTHTHTHRNTCTACGNHSPSLAR